MVNVLFTSIDIKTIKNFTINVWAGQLHFDLVAEVKNNFILPLLSGKISGRVFTDSTELATFNIDRVNVPPLSSKEVTIHVSVSAWGIVQTVWNMITRGYIDVTIEGRICDILMCMPFRKTKRFHVRS